MSLEILLIEDDKIDQMTVQRAFEKANIKNTLHVVNNGLEGLEFLKENYTNRLVILLDLNMPKMNGYEFLKEIRKDEKYKLMNVVVLTTSEAEEDLVKSYELGISGYIVKPVDTGKFVEAVASVNAYWECCRMP